MDGLTIGLIIVSIILFVSLCGVAYLYFQDEKQLAAAALALASEKANAALAAQTASATLAAQTLADAQSKSAALQAAQIAAQNALTKQQTDDAVALAQAVAAQQAIDQTQLHEALASQSAQDAAALKVAVEAQKQTDKAAMAAAIDAQKKTDLDAQVAALAQQANQHASELAAALLEQKNKAAKNQADAIAAAISNQQTIDAKQLSDALAQAKKTADDAQAAAIAAQKSTDATAAVTAATVAVVTSAQAMALAAVNTTNAILIQILTAYQNTLNAVYTQSMIIAIYRNTGILLPINSSYDLLMPYVNENLYRQMAHNKTHNMAAFFLGQINTNYITQFQVYQTTAISQHVNTTKATTSNMATAAANAAVAASITATGLSTNVINMCNTIMNIITQTLIDSQYNDKNNTDLLLQTVGIPDILNIFYQSVSDMQKLIAYGPGILNVSLSNVQSYISSITPMTQQVNGKTVVLPLTSQQIAIIDGRVSSFVAARNTISNFMARRSGFAALSANQAVVVSNSTQPMADTTIVETVSYALQNSMSIVVAPGVTNDASHNVIITDKTAAQKGAEAAMLATILNMRSIISATLTCLNMFNKYISNDYELILGIINGTGVYMYIKNTSYLDNIPKYSLELALSLSKNQIGQVTNITNNPINYVPASINLWTDFGNRFITKSGGLIQSGLLNSLPGAIKDIKNSRKIEDSIEYVKKNIQDGIICANKSNNLISPDIPLINLIKNSPCDYGFILQGIQSCIIDYEMYKSALFIYLIKIAQ